MIWISTGKKLSIALNRNIIKYTHDHSGSLRRCVLLPLAKHLIKTIFHRVNFACNSTHFQASTESVQWVPSFFVAWDVRSEHLIIHNWVSLVRRQCSYLYFEACRTTFTCFSGFILYVEPMPSRIDSQRWRILFIFHSIALAAGAVELIRCVCDGKLWLCAVFHPHFSSQCIAYFVLIIVGARKNCIENMWQILRQAQRLSMDYNYPTEDWLLQFPSKRENVYFNSSTRCQWIMCQN